MARTAAISLLLVAGAVAFQAPRSSAVARPATASFAAPQDAPAAFDVKTLGWAAAGAAPLVAAAPAHAFTAAYLPAILVPVMTLFLPVIGMGLFTILTQKEDL